MSKNYKAMVISYFPLSPMDIPQPYVMLDGDDKARDAKAARFQSYLENATSKIVSGTAEGCLWAQNENGTISAILLMNQAKEILDHLTAWADNKPQDWFHVSLLHRDGKFALALFPRLMKSVQRMSVRMMMDGEAPLTQDDCSIFFDAINFSSGDTNYVKVKDKIGKTMTVGFLDKKDLARNDSSPLGMTFDETKIYTLENMPVHNDKLSDEYLSKVLEDCQPRTMEEYWAAYG